MIAALAFATLVQVLPPPEYDHPVSPLNPADYQFISRDAMQIICNDEILAYACSHINRLGFCQVYLPNDSWTMLDADDRVMLKRHEDGHCNGWPANHPGAIIIRLKAKTH